MSSENIKQINIINNGIKCLRSAREKGKKITETLELQLNSIRKQYLDFLSESWNKIPYYINTDNASEQIVKDCTYHELVERFSRRLRSYLFHDIQNIPIPSEILGCPELQPDPMTLSTHIRLPTLDGMFK